MSDQTSDPLDQEFQDALNSMTPTPPAAGATATETTDDPQEPDDQNAEPKDEQPEASETSEASKAEPEAKPGTPDKVIQKLQQDLSAATRKLSELTSRLDEGQDLSDSEQQELSRQQRKLDVIRQKLAEFDPIEHGRDLAEGLIETDQRLERLQQTVLKLEQQIEQYEAQMAWEQARSRYAGVDVQAVWDKAVEDAKKILGPEPDEKLRRVASWMFHERCSAASKRVQNEKQTPARQTAAARPPVTPNGARVSASQSQPAVAQKSSEEAEYLEFLNRHLKVVGK